MAIGDPYISATQLKKVLGITDSAEDELINRAVLGAARAINNRCGYTTFWNTGDPETITIDTEGRIVPKRQHGYYKLLLPDGIASATGFTIAGLSGATLIGASTQFRQQKPVTEIKIPWGVSIAASWDITAVWGWPEVPADIIMANQMQAHRYYRRRGSPEGIAGSAEWGLTRIPNLDPDVRGILEAGGYMNPGIA